MNNTQLIVTLALFALLLLVNQLAGARPDCARCYGGLPWYGWAAGLVVLAAAWLAASRRGGERLRELFARPPRGRDAAQAAPGGAAPDEAAPDEKWNEALRRKYDWDGPDYPHPVIVAERCIGCHACVEACPHDVLTIGFTEKQQPVATVADHDLCVEDTSCESVCPVTPKACVVVNTAKQIKSLPAPWRDREYMSSVRGCHIIGDVSGTPLIKNAVNEGREVILHLANQLRAGRAGGAQTPAIYDVAIIGAGPAGLSAAVTAKRLGLNFICIERDTVMSTIERAYSANKYVYFKPETMEWAGGIHLPGLEEYVEEVLGEFLDAAHKPRAAELLARERRGQLDEAGRAALKAARDRYRRLVEAELSDPDLDGRQRALLAGVRRKFERLLEDEEKYALARLIGEEAEAKARGVELPAADRARLYWARQTRGEQFEAHVAERSFTDERILTLAQERRKVFGDQKEVLLNTWRLNAKEYGLGVREKETCTSVERADDGDYFVIRTEREARGGPGGFGREAERNTYQASRVVLAIGNSSSQSKLRVENATLKVTRRGKRSNKVLYRLAEPRAFTDMNLIVVGGGNSAVEAAVDLVCRREGDQITFREGGELNRVTMLVRSSDFKTDVKFGNKRQLYRCIDAGLIEVRRNTEIVRISDAEVVTKDVLTDRENPPIPNDFIFALIGSERPAALLKQMKIRIVE